MAAKRRVATSKQAERWNREWQQLRRENHIKGMAPMKDRNYRELLLRQVHLFSEDGEDVTLSFRTERGTTNIQMDKECLRELGQKMLQASRGETQDWQPWPVRIMSIRRQASQPSV
jgi:hypothetical protein